jgi:hypothetical protein
MAKAPPVVIFVEPAIVLYEKEYDDRFYFRIHRADRRYFADVVITRGALKEPYHGINEAREIAVGGAVWHFWDMITREVRHARRKAER